MAERRFLLFRDDLAELLNMLLDDGCTIALCEQRKVPEVWLLRSDGIEEALVGRSSQLFVKHRSFAGDKFISQSVNNIHSGRIFVVSANEGEGHIQILSLRSPADERYYTVSVGYISFFKSSDGMYIDPSHALKAYYQILMRFLNRRTDKLAGFPFRVSRHSRSNPVSPEVWKRYTDFQTRFLTPRVDKADNPAR